MKFNHKAEELSETVGLSREEAIECFDWTMSYLGAALSAKSEETAISKSEFLEALHTRYGHDMRKLLYVCGMWPVVYERLSRKKALEEMQRSVQALAARLGVFEEDPSSKAVVAPGSEEQQ